MLFILASVALAAPCTAPTRVETITTDLQTAELAWGSDESAFVGAVRKARDELPCLDGPMTPLDAASYHGLMALDASFSQHEDDAVRSFASALASVPTFRIPAIIAPEGGVLDLQIGKARVLPPGETQALPPYDGVVMIDGARALVRPTWRPCVLQLVRSNGAVERTYYLLGSDPLPRWDPPPTAVQRLLPKLREKPSVPFGIAAGGAALAAGGLYALGGTWDARFHDPTTPYDQLDGLKTRTNVALGGTIALGIAAAALGTVTVVHW